LQKKFISNLVLMVVLNLLIKPLSIFGIDATVQNRVGAEAYGLYFSLLNLSFLFNILIDLGINNFTTKHIAQYPHIVVRYMGKLLAFRLFLFLIYLCTTFLLAFFLGYGKVEFSLLLFLVFNQFLATMIAYCRSHFAGLLLFVPEAIISVLDRLLLICLCGYFLFFTNASFQIEWFIWMQTACYSLTFLIAFGVLIRKIGFPQVRWHLTFSRAIIKQSLPYALLILLMMFYTRMDSVMLERFHSNGKYEAGIYAQGFRLLDALFMFGMIFSNLLFPIFSYLIRKREEMRPLLKTAANLLVGGAFVVAVFSYFNAAYLLDLIYTENVTQSIPSFQLLMLSFIGMCVTLIYGTLLTANGNLLVLNIYSGIGILINLLLNMCFIPLYGAQGAAVSTLITQSIIAILQYSYCCNRFDIWPYLLNYLRTSLFVALFIVSVWCMDKYIHNPWVLWVELGLGLGLMFIFRMIDIRPFLKQMKQKS
jgi:O-antigen/teichoic acid export membrane protein